MTGNFRDRKIDRTFLAGAALPFFSLLTAAPAAAQDTTPVSPDEAAAPAGDIIVTARRREERLQDVPDAITAFGTATIENSGIESVDDFARLVPNLTFRNGQSYSVGLVYLSMRGVGNGQQGWPAVSFLVDGVPVDSLETLGGGNYEDLERIEVLRGPQSAVYGANAIAGAINIITRRPTEDFSGRILAEYAQGDDRRLSGVLSGPLIPGILRFRVQAEGRRSDGLIESASNNRGLDFAREFRTRGQLLFTPSERLSIDLRGEYNDTRTGAVYQPKVASRADLDTFSDAFRPRRRLIGQEERELYRFSLRGIYEFNGAELISITAYSRSTQDIGSSLCYDDPDDPAVDNSPAPGRQTVCLLGSTARGSAALPGEVVDEVFLGADNYRSFYHDTRIQSTGDGRLRWMVGGTHMQRSAFNGFDIRFLIAGAGGGAGCGDTVGYDPTGCGATPLIFPRWDRRRDEWWGAYAQLSYDITDALELTLAGRYDHQEYRNTQFADRARTTIVQVPDSSGTLVNTQRETANNFQPKAQLSYTLAPDIMAYITFARGFRAGFFNTGGFTAPETTTNYEGGLKTAFSTGVGRLILNGTVFHIDYSNQQFSTVIPVPPFRIPVTIPQTKIDGFEFEASLYAARGLSISGSVGYLDATIQGGQRPPLSPKWSTNLAFDYDADVSENFGLVLHADWRHSSSLLLNTTVPFDRVPPKDFISARIGARYRGVTITGFVENLTNEREQSTESVPLGTAFIRPINEPRRYGVQVRYVF